MSIVEQLARIREQQGLSPLSDPTRIDGPPMNPPPLPDNFGEATVTEQDDFTSDDEDRYDGDIPGGPSTVSPLVAAARPQPGPLVPPQTPTVPPVLTLCVFDFEAAYLGHPVVLTDKEKRQVTQIVLKALQRVVREQLASLVRLTPKRPRRGKPEASHKPVASDRRTASEIVGDIPVRPGNMPKKRGRPRGSLLGKKD